MSAEFIKMVSEVHAQRFQAHIYELANNKTPCGIFFGFMVVPSNAIANIQDLRNRGINFSCIIVIADVQANALRKFIDVPVITLEDFDCFGEENFPVKPQEIFLTEFKDFAFTSYFVRHDMKVLTYSNDGATSIDFAKCGAKVFAFEMVAANYKKCLSHLEQFGAKYDITIENFGLSNKISTENYLSSGPSSRKNSRGNLKANFIDLDTYVAQKNLPRVDYIKIDIEGAELDMLHGAAKTITRCKPKMAVSAYHKPEDLWTLATYIKSLRPDDEFEFRHYRIDCTDYALDDEERAILKYFSLSWLVPTNCEMILYCR